MKIYNSKGIIGDFVCGIQPYALNSEPKVFNLMRFLIDGAYWDGQRQLKRSENQKAEILDEVLAVISTTTRNILM